MSGSRSYDLISEHEARCEEIVGREREHRDAWAPWAAWAAARA
jgi:hypothetical protein